MWEKVDELKMVVRREGSKYEGNELRGELVNKHRVKVSPIPSGGPQRQIFLPEDVAIPLGSTFNGSGSASLRPMTPQQFMERMKQMMDQQRSDIQ